MNTLSFKKLAMMIHPDLNPTILNAGQKMADAVRARSNPSRLYRMAVEWGLIKDSTVHTHTTTTSHRATFTASENGEIKIQDIVYIMSGRRLIRGIIVDIKNVTKGVRKGFKKFFIVNQRNQKIYTSIRENASSCVTFKVIGKTDNFSDYEDIYKKHLERVDSYKKVKKERKKRSAERVMEDLAPNHNYNGSGTWIHVTTKGRSFEVTRTTAKRVYFWDDNNAKERFCNFGSVGYIFHK